MNKTIDLKIVCFTMIFSAISVWMTYGFASHLVECHCKSSEATLQNAGLSPTNQ